jgi:hypothetical protein
MSRTRLSAPIGLAVGLAAAAVAAGGCGDDTEQVSADELIARGDEICVEGRRRFDEVQAKAPANAAAAADQTDELVTIATDELNELRNIRPPDELRERYDRYLEARGRALELLEQGRDAAADNDADAYGEAQAKAAAEGPQRLKLAKAVGFKACSRG